MAVTGRLAPGLLLASPRLGDPNFGRSVVLLGHHDEDGALGWVLNGRALVPVRQLLRDASLVPDGATLPDSPSYDSLVRVGGPVTPGSAWLVYRRSEGQSTYEGEHDLGLGLSVTGAREAIEAVGCGEGPKEFRMVLGYAGWTPEQLEREVGEGAWLPAPLTPELLLELAPDNLWNVAYQRSYGTTPMAFSSHPPGSA